MDTPGAGGVGTPATDATFRHSLRVRFSPSVHTVCWKGSWMTTDIDLTIRRVLAGDTDCYAEIVRAYQKEVTKVVAAMLFDRHESEDLVQQVFIAAYERLDRFELGRDMGPWLKEIARNTVRMHIRRRKSHHRHVQFYRDWVVASYEDDEAYSRQEARLTAMQECLAGLPEKSRRLVELRFGHRMSMVGIGEEVGRSIEAVTKALSRIREGLRNCITERIVTS